MTLEGFNWGEEGTTRQVSSLGPLIKHRRTLVRIVREAKGIRNVVAFPYRLEHSAVISDLPPITPLRIAAIMAAHRFTIAAEHVMWGLRS